MTRRTWVRLDNASNIFLAARTAADPKVFRFSAELDHEVDPSLLQLALDTTFDRYPLYRAVLRSGVFWYYLQDSDLRPEVQPDVLPTCAPIYQPDHRTLLFRVIHHGRRVSLEVFHALSDGTGALWFLTDLLVAYCRLRFPAEAATASEGPLPVPGEPTVHDDAGEDPVEPEHSLTVDSFTRYFRRRRGRGADAFDHAAAPGYLGAEDEVQDEAEASSEAGAAPPEPSPPRSALMHSARVHRVRGSRTPDNRPRVLELSMPARQVIAVAKQSGASLTMYLLALFMESIRRSSGGLGRSRTLSASVPVNLRQFFPSTSARNFFATVRVEHTFGQGEDDLATIAQGLEERFRPQVTEQALSARLHSLIRLEQMALLRIVPRPLKDVLLSWANRINNRGLTVAISNMGRVTLPAPAEAHVRRMFLHVSAARPQFCSMSHAGILTISFSSPLVGTEHVREFARHLSERGVDVTVAATRVTEEELAEGAPTDGEHAGEGPVGEATAQQDRPARQHPEENAS